MRGLFIVSLMAIVMSTVDSYAFLSAITFGRDIMGSAGKDDSLVNRHTKAGLLLTALVAVGMILLMPSVIELWYNLGSLFIPPLLLPVFFAYFPKFKTGSKETFILMMMSFLTTLIIFIPGQFRESGGEPVYLFGIQPFFTGLVVSVSGYLYFRKWPLSAKRDRLQDS
jgi:SSS family solute:Na+ symporter